MDEVEARERRRAKILASKDARMARITGGNKSSESLNSPPIKIDEVLVQEYIAESKKHAVELAKEDYSLTHKENEVGPDEPLTVEQIKEKKIERGRARGVGASDGVNNQKSTKFEIFMGNVVVIISAISAAFFLLKRSNEVSLKFCLNLSQGISSENKIKTCRQGILPIFLQVVPSTLVISLLPLLSDWFKGKRSYFQVILAIFPKIILFLVIFILFLRILQ